ncbi:helix-turn-helix transcriptional regulator [Brevibacillus borstelensis]|uniref:helix-turn-helix domain-containing protein n=1 Tax=Brevibacillus borstelensis TaxID=45462 RepID=UPI002E1EA4B2|nr:helix-turn-helix transcriptional regulator [Brevibacillus borstelensis]
MLGERLKSLRTRIKLRQEDIAAKIGIARTTYAMYEQNKREPDNETLQKIADFFDVNVDFLLGRTNNPAPFNQRNKSLSEFESLFFYELDKLSEEDKQKALDHVRYLRYLAEKDTKR